MINRRNFIQMLGLTAIASVSLNLTGQTFGQSLESDELFLVPAESMSDPVFAFTSNHFKPFIGTDFQVDSRSAASLRLIEVKEHQSKANTQKNIQGESFSLIFHSSREIKISQDQTNLNHGALGALKLFISPIGLEPNYYEAVINHLRQ